MNANELIESYVADVAAPALPYEPPMPRAYRPRIALVGAGGIAAAHLEAYRDAGFDVAVIASRTLKSAVARRDAFFPEAEATEDVERTLRWLGAREVAQPGTSSIDSSVRLA